MEPAPEPNVEWSCWRPGTSAAYACSMRAGPPAVLRVAAAMLADVGEAEDALHDVFVGLARGRERLRYVEDLDAYVLASLRHAIAARIDRRRIERARTGTHRVDPAPARHSAEPADGELAAALASLPSEQREVVVMKIDGGLTFAHCAGARY